MNNDINFEDILNECITRILEGESIEQCLRNYPEQASELQPLLRTAIAAQKASAIEPRPEFKASSRYQFYSQMQEEAKKGRSPFKRLRWATAPIIGAVIVASGSGTVLAAENSMPEDFLYPVKLATEQAQIALTLSETGKAKLHVKFADRRVTEITVTAEKGKPEMIVTLTENMNRHLEKMEVLVNVQQTEIEQEEKPSEKEEKIEEVNELRGILIENASKNEVALKRVSETAPEETRAALKVAVVQSTRNYSIAIRATKVRAKEIKAIEEPPEANEETGNTQRKEQTEDAKNEIELNQRNGETSISIEKRTGIDVKVTPSITENTQNKMEVRITESPSQTEGTTDIPQVKIESRTNTTPKAEAISPSSTKIITPTEPNTGPKTTDSQLSQGNGKNTAITTR